MMIVEFCYNKIVFIYMTWRRIMTVFLISSSEIWCQESREVTIFCSVLQNIMPVLACFLWTERNGSTQGRKNGSRSVACRDTSAYVLRVRARVTTYSSALRLPRFKYLVWNLYILRLIYIHRRSFHDFTRWKSFLLSFPLASPFHIITSVYSKSSIWKSKF